MLNGTFALFNILNWLSYMKKLDTEKSVGVSKPLCAYYKFYVKSSDFMNAEICDRNFFVNLLFFRSFSP